MTEKRPKPRTVLLVLNYKKYTDTLNFLESVRETELLHAGIIILDNASQNDSILHIRSWIDQRSDGSQLDFRKKLKRALANPQSQHIRLEHAKGHIALLAANENLGFSRGNNALGDIGCQMGYEFLYFLNSDIVFTDKFSVTKLEALHDREKDAYLSGPCVINLDGSFDSPFRRDSFWGDALYYGPVNRLRRVWSLPIVQFDINALSKPMGSQVYKVSGAAMFFPALRFLEIGGLDENVWLSSEEAILGEKIRSRSGKVYYLPTTVLVHVKASAPRKQSTKIAVLHNHFAQRNYYYRSYRNYGACKLFILSIGQKLRKFIARF
jgi:GT2 family glycosyltransferase